MKKIEKLAEEYAKHNQCCIPIHDKANIAEIRFEKIRDAYLAGHTAGRIAGIIEAAGCEDIADLLGSIDDYAWSAACEEIEKELEQEEGESE